MILSQLKNRQGILSIIGQFVNKNFIWQLFCRLRQFAVALSGFHHLNCSYILETLKVLTNDKHTHQSRGGSRGRVQGVRTPPPPPPPPRDDLRFCDTTGILRKKTTWFIGVEVEQETSAPPPKKNRGSAPATMG